MHILTDNTNSKWPFLDFSWLIQLFYFNFLLLIYSNRKKVSDTFNTIFQLKVIKNLVQVKPWIILYLRNRQRIYKKWTFTRISSSRSAKWCDQIFYTIFYFTHTNFVDYRFCGFTVTYICSDQSWNFFHQLYNYSKKILCETQQNIYI